MTNSETFSVASLLLKVSQGRGTAWRLALALRAKVLGLLGSKYIAG
jgi:hypothetical protein